MPVRLPAEATVEDVLKALTEAGCERRILCIMMETLRRSPFKTGMETLCGYEDGRQLASSVATARAAAAIVRRWNHSLLGEHALKSHTIRRLQAERDVPGFLEWFATEMESRAPRYSHRRNYLPNLARAWLTNYVRAKTHAWCDAAVAVLASRALGTYTTTANQRTWRKDNTPLLESESATPLWALPNLRADR